MNQALPRKLAWNSRRFYEAFFFRLRTFAGGRWADWCQPISVTVLLTERCNARCLHCDIWKNKGREAHPTPQQWKRFIDDIAGWFGPASVLTFTGGEALLQPFAAEVVEHAVRRGIFTELLTHGYWSDHTRLERVARANPWRVTMSLDGIGPTHSLVRGRDNFWDLSFASLMALKEWRRQHGLDYTVRLKTVIMRHNLDGVAEVAGFACEHGFEVFYQPIEQNYNTPEDPQWYLSSPNWPQDSAAAVRAIEQLITLKREGYPIANSERQLRIMTGYFADPARLSVRVRGHHQEQARTACSALTMLQLQANGDVMVCNSAPPVGNIKDASIRQIWRQRPQWWKTGCCLERRCSESEKQDAALVTLP